MEQAARGFAANIPFHSRSMGFGKSRRGTRSRFYSLLKDIQSLGYDAEAVVQTLKPPAAVALMDYFARSVRDSNPIDCIGYTYTMERLSLGIDEAYIQKIEAITTARS